MAETPDFNKIAAPLAEYADDTRRKQIAEQLRRVWNARGAADLATIESLTRALRGVDIAGDAAKILRPAIRELDVA